MKLSELTLSKDLQHASSAWNHVDILQGILARNGWHMLGKGAEAAVAEHPRKSYVLKIFTSSSKYVKFVQFVQNHSQNPHLPKFSRYVKQVPGTNFSYVRMEKLSGISKDEIARKYVPYLITLAQAGDETRTHILNWNLESKMHEALEAQGWNSQDPVNYDHMYELVGGAPPQDWQDIVHEMATYAKEMGIDSWDLHAANFLLRGETLVIADPFY